MTRIEDSYSQSEAPNSKSLLASVIIPTFNRPKCLGNLLEQLTADPAGIGEIIVVDQGANPTMTSSGLARRLHQLTPCATAARNAGVQAAKFPVVIILDDDIAIGREFVRRHLENFNNSQIGAVQGAVIQPGRCLDSHLPYTFYLPHIGYAHFPLHHNQIVDGMVNIASGNMSIRRELFFEAGGFDGQYEFDRFVDTDFSLRVWRLLKGRGMLVRHDPRVAVNHLMTQEGKTRQWEQEQNEPIMNRKHWDMTFYFYLKNFGWRNSWREVAVLFRLHILRRPYFLKPTEMLAAYREMKIGYCSALQRLRDGRKLMLGHSVPAGKEISNESDAFFWMTGDERLVARQKNYGGLFNTVRRMFKPGVDFEEHPT